MKQPNHAITVLVTKIAEAKFQMENCQARVKCSRKSIAEENANAKRYAVLIKDYAQAIERLRDDLLPPRKMKKPLANFALDNDAESQL